MSIPRPYFKDVPGIGDLSVERILEEYDYALLFVLKDKDGKRYVCTCFDTRKCQRWLLAPISDENLVRLLRNGIQIRDTFLSDTSAYYVRMDYKTREDTYKMAKTCDIPRDWLPDEGYLDAPPHEWDDYIREIEDGNPSYTWSESPGTKSHVMQFAKDPNLSSARVILERKTCTFEPGIPGEPDVRFTWPIPPVRKDSVQAHRTLAERLAIEKAQSEIWHHEYAISEITGMLRAMDEHDLDVLDIWSFVPHELTGSAYDNDHVVEVGNITITVNQRGDVWPTIRTERGNQTLIEPRDADTVWESLEDTLRTIEDILHDEIEHYEKIIDALE